MKPYFIKIGIVDENGDIKIVGVFIARGIVTDLIAVFILTQDLAAAFIDVQITAGHVGKIQNIRVGFCQISGPRHHELPSVLVQEHLGNRAEGSGGVE